MCRVLVVDDDRSVVFMLTEVLRDAGHEVIRRQHLRASADAVGRYRCSPGGSAFAG